MANEPTTNAQETGASEADVSVANAGASHRYEITADNELAGFTEYVDNDSQRIFYHTEIDDRFSGRGLAGRLVTDALRETRAEGKRIVAICPYVTKYMDKHDEFNDLRDPVTPAAHAAVRNRDA